MQLIKPVSLLVTIFALFTAACAPQTPDEKVVVNTPSIDEMGNMVIPKEVVAETPPPPPSPPPAVEKPAAPAVAKADDPRNKLIAEGNKAFARVKSLVGQVQAGTGIKIYANDAKTKAAQVKWNRFNSKEISLQRGRLTGIISSITRIQELAAREGIGYTKWELRGGLKLIKGNAQVYADSLEKYSKTRKGSLTVHTFRKPKKS